MSRFRPRSLFAKTLLTIAVVSVGFQAFTLLVIGYLMLVPLGQRSADDLAALMSISARSWAALPESEREAFSQRLLEEKALALTGAQDLEPSSNLLPYIYFLKNAFNRRLGREITVWSSWDTAGTEWFWVDVPVAGGEARIGFSRERIGVHPPIAFFLLLSVGILVTFTTAVALVHRLTSPLQRLSLAVRRLGRGEWPEPIPESGAEELAALARSFNRMNRQVQELLANRTTLLAGISHDLRTPLARMRLALAMLPEDADSELVSGMERDLEEMNRLIGQFLEISRDLEEGAREPTDVGMLIDEIVCDTRRGGATIRWEPRALCRRVLHPLALHRIVGNLMENAVRYGGGAPVEVGYECSAERLTVRILDRGPGIPAEERDAVFRPFYRLEQSRNMSTGGSGLGLAIARQLANANGWELQLLPREGGGTEARLTLPAKSAPLAADTCAASAELA